MCSEGHVHYDVVSVEVPRHLQPRKCKPVMLLSLKLCDLPARRAVPFECSPAFFVELSELSKRGQWSHALKNVLFALVSQHKTTSSAMGRGNSYERRKLAAYNDE